MMSTLAGLLSAGWKKALPYVIGAVAFLGFLFGILRMLLGAGRSEERADTATTIIKDVQTRHEVDTRVELEPDPLGRLRSEWSRD